MSEQLEASATVAAVSADLDARIARSVADALAGRSLVTAESCTAGRVAAAFASVGEASDFLRGGVIAYHEDVKRSALGVVAESVYSEQAVDEMARGVRALLQGDVAVATSGVVGGDPVEGIEPGTVFVATCVDATVRTARHRFDGSPEAVCADAVGQALRDLLAHLSAQPVRAS